MSDGIPMGRARVRAEQEERAAREVADAALEPEEREPELDATAALFPVLTNPQAALLAAGLGGIGYDHRSMDGLLVNADRLLAWLDERDIERLEASDEH